MIKVALPNKGVLFEPTLDLLNEPTIHHLLRDEGIKVHVGPF